MRQFSDRELESVRDRICRAAARMIVAACKDVQREGRLQVEDSSLSDEAFGNFANILDDALKMPKSLRAKRRQLEKESGE